MIVHSPDGIVPNAQITELTRGRKLPFRPMQRHILSLIIGLVRQAWDGLSEDYPDEIRTSSEAYVNDLVEKRIVDILDRTPLLKRILSSVARGKESDTYDGTRIEVRPDLSFFLKARHHFYPLIVECKIIDVEEGKNLNLYQMHGIRRFVEGEYAWGVQECIMIAYVRDGSTIYDCLLPLFDGDKCRFPSIDSQIIVDADGIAVSRHTRSFRYIHDPDRSDPGPISVFHLWLKTPSLV